MVRALRVNAIIFGWEEWGTNTSASVPRRHPATRGVEQSTRKSIRKGFRQMKKSLLIASMMVVALAACGKKEAPAPAPTPAPAAAPAPAPAPAPAADAAKPADATAMPAPAAAPAADAAKADA